MSGDYSRIAFDPWLDDLGVLLEQGRPLTDRDWNDLVLQITRRIQAGTLDTIGAAVVPMQTPEGFEILASGGALTIGRGRIYVDGLLAENHGAPPSGGTLDWDPKLAELFGTGAVSYEAQPYYPNPAALPTEGRHLVYLDVWQREVTRYQRPALIEPALGVDTSTRLQTVWQVRVLPESAGDLTCATPLDQFPGWLPAHAHSAGRLTVATAPVPNQPDPCQVPPAAGYKGLENQLYRVEIHTPGALGTATFKWSRDDASIEAAVLEIPSLTQIVVDSVGRDAVLRFSDGDWIEIIDDWLELHHLPGPLYKIKIGGGVEDATRTITLEQALPAGLFPTDPQHQPDPLRHTRIRRWDQKKKVFDAAGTEIQDLDALGSDGSILVPTGGTQVLLEHNIVVDFDVEPATGAFRTGDYWVFAARSGEEEPETLTAAPPRGIHHHYTKLALVTFPDSETNCRSFWPPPQAPAGEPGDTCACTVCVTPADHANGTMTVQMAIDEVIGKGGGTVCLEVGQYVLESPLLINDARSLRIVGKGDASRLLSTTSVMRITESSDVTVECVTVTCRPAATAPDAAVAIVSSRDVRVRQVSIGISNNNPAWAALDLQGALVGVSVSQSALAGAIGIRSGTAEGSQTGLTDLRIEDNGFECRTAAMRLAGVTLHQFVSAIRRNRIVGCRDAAITLSGATVPGQGLEISGNSISVDGHGIVSSLDGVRVLENDILQAQESPGPRDAIQLVPGLTDDVALEDVRIVGNRITGFQGTGVNTRAPRVRGLMIAQNQIVRGGQGVVFRGNEWLERVAIEHNQLRELEGPAIFVEASLVMLAVTGNQTQTADQAVNMMSGRGEMEFADNQCERRGAGPENSPDILLRSGTLIVASNRVIGGPLSMDLATGQQHFTVLGNICRGRILLNGAPLPNPWITLNQQSVP